MVTSVRKKGHALQYRSARSVVFICLAGDGLRPGCSFRGQPGRMQARKARRQRCSRRWPALRRAIANVASRRLMAPPGTRIAWTDRSLEQFYQILKGLVLNAD